MERQPDGREGFGGLSYKENYPQHWKNYENVLRKRTTMNMNIPLTAFKSTGKDDQKECPEYNRRYHFTCTGLAKSRTENAKRGVRNG